MAVLISTDQLLTWIRLSRRTSCWIVLSKQVAFHLIQAMILEPLHYYSTHTVPSLLYSDLWMDLC